MPRLQQRIIKTLKENYIKFENTEISVIIDNDDNVWFSSTDVANALDYKDTKRAIKDHVDNDDKIKLEDINTDILIKKHPHTSYINESGLYALLYSSKMKTAKKFKKWVNSEVLPTVRKFNYIELRDNYDKTMKTFGDKISFLQDQNKKLRGDMKKEKYPKGAVFYVLDYTDDYRDEVIGEERVYRIGIADDMKSRKALYDTHMLHNKKAVINEELKTPSQFEICMESALYDYRYSDRKSFYICSKKVLMNSFEKCKKMLLSKKVQKGGGNNVFEDDISELQKKKQEIGIRIMIIDEELAKYNDESESSSDETDSSEDIKPKNK
jgi:anti-repressor protein